VAAHIQSANVGDSRQQIGLEGLAPQLAEFWPARGPVWDGPAVYPTPGGEGGVILIEGKSYPGEL
jgi:hypothetical protein